MSGRSEETELRTMPLARFAEALAAATPAPGSSSAAAVPGALAAGLVAMAARLTARGDPFGDFAFDAEDVASQADRLRLELLDLIDEDFAAFDRVMVARRLHLDDVQDGYREAVEPLLDICRLSARVLELAVEVAERGDPHMTADARVAALFAAASLEAAAIDVEAELAAVDDELFRRARMREVEEARDRAARTRVLLDVPS